MYNYDSIIEGKTETVIIVEGIFDVVALNRKLDLYDSDKTAVVATFGKKISQVQSYKTQSKGVKKVIIAYDSDAVEAIKKTASELIPLFVNVMIADNPYLGRDWEELSLNETRDVFQNRLRTPLNYAVNKVQE